jgi:hypothetical protein
MSDLLSRAQPYINYDEKLLAESDGNHKAQERRKTSKKIKKGSKDNYNEYKIS